MPEPRHSHSSVSSRRSQWRQAVLDLLGQEHTPAQVASLLRMAPWTAREVIKDLLRERLVMRVARGRYLRASSDRAILDEPLRLIRDLLLEYLSEPRQVADVARHIGRSASTTTGHLSRLMRQHLVVRVEYGIYIRHDCFQTWPDRSATQPRSPMLRTLCGQIDRETSIEVLCQTFCRSERQVRQYLRLMIQAGTIERVGRRHYRPAQMHLFPITE